MTTAILAGAEMSRILNKVPGAHDLIPGMAAAAPLEGLSCPHSSRAVGRRDTRRQDRISDSCADAQCGDADPWHWRASLTTDYWNPPTSESQHARQRILAVAVAFILAAILAQAGW